MSGVPGQLSHVLNSRSRRFKIIAVLDPVQTMARALGMIHFSAGLLLSVGQSSTLTVKIKCTCMQGVSQSEVYPGSAGSDREFI